MIVVSGPSGVGKGTICKEVSKLTGIRIAISATSREKRAGEEDGRDYYYIPEDEFREKIDRGEFLEYAVVYGHYYGTLLSEVTGDEEVLLEIDVQGGLKLMRDHKDALTIFLEPPSLEELKKRLIKRGRESEAAMAARLTAASAEIEVGHKRYKHVVVNDDVSRAAAEIIDIIKNNK